MKFEDTPGGGCISGIFEKSTLGGNNMFDLSPQIQLLALNDFEMRGKIFHDVRSLILIILKGNEGSKQKRC